MGPTVTRRRRPEVVSDMGALILSCYVRNKDSRIVTSSGSAKVRTATVLSHCPGCCPGVGPSWCCPGVGCPGAVLGSGLSWGRAKLTV